MKAPPASVRIRLRDLPPAAGLHWIRRGFRLFWRRPAGFVGLWAFLTLCVFILMVLAVAVSPLVLLALAAMLPLVTVGYMQAASDVLDDLPLRPGVFRAPFASTAQAARGMLALMALYVVAVATLAACAHAMDGGATLHWLQAVMTPPPDGKPPVVPPMTDAVVSSMRFVMLGLTVVSIPLWYAPALVNWGRQGAAQALFSSVVALWRTRGAFVSFVAGWFLISIAFDAVVQLLAQVFGIEAVSLGVLTGQMMLSICYFLSMWYGFVDTFEISSPVALRTVMANSEPPAA